MVVEKAVVTEFVDKEEVLDIIETFECDTRLSMQERIASAIRAIEAMRGLMILPNTFPEDE